MARNVRIRFMDNNLAAVHTPILAPTETVLKPFSNCFTDSRSQVWESTGLVETITYDFTYQRPVGYIALIGPHEQEFGLTPAATVTLEGNNIDDWTTPPFSQEIPVTDDGAMAFLDTDAGIPEYRYWRIVIDDSTSPASSLSIGTMYLGDYKALTQRNVQSGFSRTNTDPAKTFKSEDGALFFDQKTKYLEFTGVSLGFLDPIDKADLELIFGEFGISKPLFVSFDPTLKVSSDIHELTRYMLFRDRPFFQHIKESIYTMNLQLREHV
jgi:hypothetical protein